MKYYLCLVVNTSFYRIGTETINYVFKGVYEKYLPQKIHIITTKIEHVAILECCKYF